MQFYRMLGADEVAKVIGCKKTHAYKIIRTLNAELSEKGYLVPISGKVPEKYLRERIYAFPDGEGSEQ